MQLLLQLQHFLLVNLKILLFSLPRILSNHLLDIMVYLQSILLVNDCLHREHGTVKGHTQGWSFETH